MWVLFSLDSDIKIKKLHLHLHFSMLGRSSLFQAVFFIAWIQILGDNNSSSGTDRNASAIMGGFFLLLLLQNVALIAQQDLT